MFSFIKGSMGIDSSNRGTPPSKDVSPTPLFSEDSHEHEHVP